ncbi:hypothetical protein PO909_006485 [Leuciscus waleckii]
MGFSTQLTLKSDAVSNAAPPAWTPPPQRHLDTPLCPASSLTRDTVQTRSLTVKTQNSTDWEISAHHLPPTSQSHKKGTKILPSADYLVRFLKGTSTPEFFEKVGSAQPFLLLEICNHAQPEGGDLEYTYDPGGLHMEKHWGIQPQVEYFNPRGGKVACQGKDTCSERLTVEIHMWGSPRGGTMHMEAPSQARKLPEATLAMTSSVLEETQGL